MSLSYLSIFTRSGKDFARTAVKSRIFGVSKSPTHGHSPTAVRVARERTGVGCRVFKRVFLSHFLTFGPIVEEESPRTSDRIPESGENRNFNKKAKN